MRLANGDEVKLTFNIGALCKIEEEFNGLTDLTDLMEDPTHTLRNTIKLIRIGINATIQKDNLINGTKRPFYTDDQLAALFDFSDIGELRAMIAEAMTESNKTTFETDTDSKNE